MKFGIITYSGKCFVIYAQRMIFLSRLFFMDEFRSYCLSLYSKNFENHSPINFKFFVLCPAAFGKIHSLFFCSQPVRASLYSGAFQHRKNAKRKKNVVDNIHFNLHKPKITTEVERFMWVFILNIS